MGFQEDGDNHDNLLCVTVFSTASGQSSISVKGIRNYMPFLSEDFSYEVITFVLFLENQILK